MIIQKNAVYRLSDSENGESYLRLLYDNLTNCFLIDIYKPNAKVYTLRSVEFQQQVLSGELVRATDPFESMLRLPDEYFSNAQLKLRDKNFRIMSPLLELPPEKRFDPSERLKTIKLMLSFKKYDENYISKKNLYKLEREYNQRGQMPNAIMGNYGNCGWYKHKRQANLYSKKLGRGKSGFTEEERRAGVLITPDIEEKLYSGALLYWQKKLENGHRNSWQDALDLTHRKFFELRSERKSDVKVPILPAIDDLPTLAQFKRVYYTRVNQVERAKGRHGKKNYDNNLRPKTGSQMSLTDGPLTHVQIDSTKLPIKLVHRVLNQEIGQPTLTFLRDTFSRLICGFSLTYKAESWTSVALAIHNMTLNKVEYCKDFDIDIEDYDWPCHYLFENALSDNGPMISKCATELKNSLGINLENAASGRGDMKGLIESGFDHINRKLIHKLPGAILPATKEDYDNLSNKSSEMACLNIDELTILIIHYIVEFNTSVIADYPLTNHMRAMSTPPIPTELWNYGCVFASGKGREIDPETVLLNCLLRGDAKITQKGLKFSHRMYSCDPELSVKAALDGSKKMPILYDPRNMKYVYSYLGNIDGQSPQRRLETHYFIGNVDESGELDIAEIQEQRIADHLRRRVLSQDSPTRKAEFDAKRGQVVAAAQQRKKVQDQASIKLTKEEKRVLKKDEMEQESQSLMSKIASNSSPPSQKIVSNEQTDAAIPDEKAKLFLNHLRDSRNG